MSSTQVVILAGGRGSRLAPLSNSLPKPMISVQGRPFLEILLQLLQSRGLSKFLLLTGYLHNKISDYFNDGSNLGVSIKYSVEHEPLGTAGALKNAEKLLEDDFLLLNGDTFSDIDYNNFIRFSNDRNKICSMLCYNGPIFDDIKYNLTFVKNDVIDYSKMTTKNSFNAVDAGLYFMKKDITKLLKNEFSGLEEKIFPLLISDNQLSGLATKSRFYDIGTVERLGTFNSMFRGKE